MKNIYIRFLAIVAVIVMALGCTVVAFAEEENPYKDYTKGLPMTGIIIPAETAIRLEPSGESEQIGTLKGGTACLVKGHYYGDDMIKYCIVDLAGLNINGHETGYGFIDSFDVFLNPKWLMLEAPTLMYAIPWDMETVYGNTYNGKVSGLVMVIDKNDKYYAIRTMDNVSGTSFISTYHVHEYSRNNLDLRVVPFSTPVYDESKKEQVGEIPAFTIISLEEREGDFFNVIAYPGTTYELCGWIPWQPILELLN